MQSTEALHKDHLTPFWASAGPASIRILLEIQEEIKRSGAYEGKHINAGALLLRLAKAQPFPKSRLRRRSLWGACLLCLPHRGWHRWRAGPSQREYIPIRRAPSLNCVPHWQAHEMRYFSA